MATPFSFSWDLRPEFRRVNAALRDKPDVQCVEVTVGQLLYWPCVEPMVPRYGEEQVSGLKVIISAHLVLENNGPIFAKLSDIHLELKVPGHGTLRLKSWTPEVLEAVVRNKGDWRKWIEFQGFLGGVDALSRDGLQCWLVLKPVGAGWCKAKVAQLPNPLRFSDSEGSPPLGDRGC